MRRRFVNYPNEQLLAVLDAPAAASEAQAALVAAGFAPDRITVLAGPDAAGRLDGLGASGLVARLLRVVQFMAMDQMPDFYLYEVALRDGRAVVAVRETDEARRRRATAILRAAGAHFMNYYGRFSTEEISLWRGPEPKVPDFLRR